MGNAGVHCSGHDDDVRLTQRGPVFPLPGHPSRFSPGLPAALLPSRSLPQTQPAWSPSAARLSRSPPSGLPAQDTQASQTPLLKCQQLFCCSSCCCYFCSAVDISNICIVLFKKSFMQIKLEIRKLHPLADKAFYCSQFTLYCKREPFCLLFCLTTTKKLKHARSCCLKCSICKKKSTKDAEP